ncbi:hypothetical protein GJ744_000463 [Endocarpon pusillum]|uniref:Biogenesis of lysosome-related organelles complex 1 subunit CNL1 n=1 Tax=Endocarpon pusillum TaxID=364733 RepID=A0A8H7AEV1_9EURO|nr:hypothetical protein GJ744_000463 [Endocarpon pusillum]
MSLPQSIADTNLGLTASEIQILRQQQQIAAQGHATQSQAGRGRGQSRSSNPSSRAASAASSQGGPGRVFLDPGSLQRLYAHFEHLMRRIQDRIADLEEATERSVQASYDRAGNMIQNADAEIARMKRIMAEIDHLEGEFDKVKRIRDVIKELRKRVDDLDRRMDQARSGHSQAASGGPRRR